MTKSLPFGHRAESLVKSRIWLYTKRRCVVDGAVIILNSFDGLDWLSDAELASLDIGGGAWGRAKLDWRESAGEGSAHDRLILLDRILSVVPRL